MYRILTITIITLFITACTQTTTLDIPTQTPLPNDNDNPPENWIIKGKMGFKSPNNNGTVSINWRQQNDSYRIQVRAPLGQGSALIYGNDANITIEQAGKPTLRSSNTDQFINESLGLPLPMENLLFWLRGIPNPESPESNVEYDSSGHMSQFEQSQWSVQFSRYKLIDQWYLPGKIIASQDNNKFIFIISEWQLL